MGDLGAGMNSSFLGSSLRQAIYVGSENSPGDHNTSAEATSRHFEESEQSVYAYLEDVSKVCNERFASLLGYDSPKGWAAIKENFPEAFVSPKYRKALVSA